MKTASPQHWWKHFVFMSNWKEQSSAHNFFFRSFEGRLNNGAWPYMARTVSHDFLQCLHSNSRSMSLGIKMLWGLQLWKETTSGEAVVQFTICASQDTTNDRLRPDKLLRPVSVLTNLRHDMSLFRNKDGHYPWQTWTLNLVTSGFFRGDLIMNYNSPKSMIDNPKPGTSRTQSHIALNWVSSHPTSAQAQSILNWNQLSTWTHWYFPRLDPAT